MTLSSNMMFEFDATDDYRFVLRLWYIGKQFIQFLCYRKNVEFSKVELAAPCENGTHETFAELYVLDEGVDTEIQTLKDGRYIKQAYISGHEGQILSDIASEKLYLRHLPDSFQSGKHTTFQLNPGNHFKDVVQRTAAGLQWLLSREYDP